MELYAAIRCLIENGYAVIEHLPCGGIALVTTKLADRRKGNAEGFQKTCDAEPGFKCKTAEGFVN